MKWLLEKREKIWDGNVYNVISQKIFHPKLNVSNVMNQKVKQLIMNYLQEKRKKISVVVTPAVAGVEVVTPAVAGVDLEVETLAVAGVDPEVIIMPLLVGVVETMITREKVIGEVMIM